MAYLHSNSQNDEYHTKPKHKPVAPFTNMV